jgi:hypothetical protein
LAADPHVTPSLDDTPRQLPNLAPGVRIPPAHAWVPDRPGDDVAYGQPHGRLLGTPGPNIGFALLLAHHLQDRLTLTPSEHLGDVVAVISEVAMKRASSYGRAPVLADLEAAATILGYLGGCDPDDALWRERAIADAEHDYPTRRAICDAVAVADLRYPLETIRARALEVRRQLRAAWHPGDA